MDFQYQARDDHGRKRDGTIRAASEEEAVKSLQGQGLYVISIGSGDKKSFWKKEINLRKKVSPREVAAFSRQFAVMVQSNIPIVSGLQALARQSNNNNFRSIILDVAARVEEGTALSRALAEHPKVFNYFFVSVIQSGEASGRMGESLNYLADHMEREYKLRSQIKGAMIYPIFVLVVAMVAFVFLMVVVIPTLLDALEKFGQDLPWVTRQILAVSAFFSSWRGVILFLALIGLIVWVFYWFRTPRGKKVLDRWLLKAPFGVGLFFQKFYLTRFSQNLSVLIESGLPISDALKITGDIVGNNVYQEAIQKVQVRVVRGERISGTLRVRPDLFHPFVVQMIEVGEQTGQVGNILSKVVDFYQEDISRTVDSMASIVEPILILILGGLVGFLVLAVFLPIFSVQMAALGG